MEEQVIPKKNRTRLIIKKRDENIALKLEDVAFIYRENAVVFVVDKEQRKYISNKNLAQLESELDPAKFFRVNRKYILNVDVIKSYKPLDKVKLEVQLVFPTLNHQIVVSQEMAPVFKKWISEDL